MSFLRRAAFTGATGITLTAVLYAGAQLENRGYNPIDVGFLADEDVLTHSSPTGETASAVPDPMVTESVAPIETPVDPNALIKGSSDTHYRGLSAAQIDSIENCGNTSDKVLFTFDDGGSVKHVDDIQAYLQSRGLGAIFFPNNEAFDDSRSQQLRDNGFWVGNHTYSHENLLELGEQDAINQIASGVESDLFRPPFGGTYSENGVVVFDNRVSDMAASLGKRLCMWTVDTKDYSGSPAEEISTKVLSEVQPGGVVLMHMFDHSNALDALPLIEQGLAERGIGICSISAEPTSPDLPDVLPC